MSGIKPKEINGAKNLGQRSVSFVVQKKWRIQMATVAAATPQRHTIQFQLGPVEAPVRSNSS